MEFRGDFVRGQDPTNEMKSFPLETAKVLQNTFSVTIDLPFYACALIA